jgi:hypothetical protein
MPMKWDDETKRAFVELALLIKPELSVTSPFHNSAHVQAKIQRQCPTLARLVGDYESNPPLETRVAS